VGGPNTRSTNPRWWTIAILKKAVKSPYLCDRLTDFLKSKIEAAIVLKITKIAISPNGLTDLYEIWYGETKCVS